MANVPSMDEWMKEAKQSEYASEIGMYLVHNGVVRQTPRAYVRDGAPCKGKVTGMEFSYDASKVNEAIRETYCMSGVFYIRVWLNEGRLKTGDDIMYVMVGGDIRPHVIAALESLVGNIKKNCVTEREVFEVE